VKVNRGRCAKYRPRIAAKCNVAAGQEARVPKSAARSSSPRSSLGSTPGGVRVRRRRSHSHRTIDDMTATNRLHASPEEASFLDVLIDRLETNEVMRGFHWRTLPMRDDAAAVQKFESFVAEPRAWKALQSRSGARRDGAFANGRTCKFVSSGAGSWSSRVRRASRIGGTRKRDGVAIHSVRCTSGWIRNDEGGARAVMDTMNRSAQARVAITPCAIFGAGRSNRLYSLDMVTL
jgi:hypothetical protein